MLYRYRLYLADRTEAGEAHYAVRIKPDQIVWGPETASSACSTSS